MKAYVMLTALVLGLTGCNANLPSSNLDPLIETALPETTTVKKWLVSGQSNAEAGTFAFRFAQHMQDIGHSLVLLPAAEGGKDIECFNGGLCYQQRVLPYAEEKLDGVLFWQGETDAVHGLDPETYKNRLIQVINLYRFTFGDAQLPFVIVVLEKYAPCVTENNPSISCEEPRSWEGIRQAQREVASTLDFVYAVETEDLTNGNVHPVDAYAKIGKRIFETVKDVL